MSTSIMLKVSSEILFFNNYDYQDLRFWKASSIAVCQIKTDQGTVLLD